MSEFRARVEGMASAATWRTFGHERSDWFALLVRRLEGLVFGTWLVSVSGNLLVASAAPSQPQFHTSQIQGKEELLFCDLDGDGMQDLVLLQSNRLFIFYQDSKQGFNLLPEQEASVGEKPGVVWLARLGRKAESLLLATSDGVAELCFTNRAAPPAQRLIIRQQSLIPKLPGEGWPTVARFPLSAGTKSSWPLIFLPVDEGLQVWQHREEWQLLQTHRGIAQTRLWPSVRDPGYTRFTGLDLSIGDLNGDGREDLLVRSEAIDGTLNYELYLQGADDRFESEPAMRYSEKPERDSWLYWVDVNHDGKVDLIKSIRSGDPWFMPGVQSGKVLVGVYLADTLGRLAATPQQAFRKNDAMSVVPIVDIDGDGYPDMVLGSAPFDSREGVRKMITAKQLTLTLRFYFNRPGSGYPANPDCQAEVIFHLDQRSMYLGSPSREYFEGVVNLSGDFDGDGRKDLLVKDHSDQVSVYRFISREKGFSREATQRFDCGEPIDWLEIRDLNGDGVSDLIVKAQKSTKFRIFTSCP